MPREYHYFAEDRTGRREIPAYRLESYFRMVENYTGMNRLAAQQSLALGRPITLPLSTGDLKLTAELRPEAL